MNGIGAGVADAIGLAPHPERELLLHEAHARPFQACEGETRFLHFAFATDDAEARADREAVESFCRARGEAVPSREARHFCVTFGEAGLRWEQHAEFTTYTWSVPAAEKIEGVERLRIAPIRQPGPHLVSVDLIVTRCELPDGAGFEPASLALAHVYNNAATVASDFKADADGFVRIVVNDRRLSPVERGSLAQRLLELETYRVLALRGLVEARKLAPSVSAIERDLADLTSAMTEATAPEEDERLLQRLTELAVRLEAGAAGALYRFGASRAYAAIVQGRLTVIGEERSEGISTLSEFLGRRLAPAMRTCVTLEERQANLSRKLARAAQLLRTRVEVELARQNRDLLSAMNTRTDLQSQIQESIEWLSIVAITYYLLAIVKFAVDAIVPTATAIVVALLILPVLVGTIAFVYVVRNRVLGPHRGPK